MIVVALILALQVSWPSVDRGWVLTGESDNRALFVKRGPRPNLVWMRQENIVTSSTGVRSIVSLVELDCPGGRSRFIQGSYYGQPNMEGPTLRSDTEVSEWTYPNPDTIAESFFAVACQ